MTSKELSVIQEIDTGDRRRFKLQHHDHIAKTLAINLVSDVMLLILACDLLYLYYAGGWIEANKVILVAELVVLYALIPFSIWRFFAHIREALKN